MTAALQRTGPHLLVAFGAMGLWAAFANSAHPWPEALAAGAVQGAMSAALTLVMKRLTEAVVRWTEGWRARLAPPLACGALSVSVLSVAHGLAGTPEVLATVAVPVAVSTTYAALYALALTKPGGRPRP